MRAQHRDGLLDKRGASGHRGHGQCHAHGLLTIDLLSGSSCKWPLYPYINNTVACTMHAQVQAIYTFRFFAVGPHMFSGCKCSSTLARSRKPSSTMISATGLFSLRAMAAASVHFLYPMWGSRAVTIPMLLCTISWQRSRFAVIPDTHRSRRMFMPLVSTWTEVKSL